MYSYLHYLFQVLSHKWFVLVGGLKVGKIPIHRLIIHDWSKFTPLEFDVYRRRYTKNHSYTESEWKYAWLHHIHQNPHHWEHWLLRENPLQMPETYVREMVADWLAAGRSYQGSFNIQPWIDANACKMILHPETIKILSEILCTMHLKWPD